MSEVAPADGVMIPGDCSECGSTKVKVEMDTPTSGSLECLRCHAVERFDAAKMETFEEMLGL